MEKAIIIYDGSVVETKDISQKIGECLKVKYEVVEKDISKLNIEEIEEFDLIIFGSASSNFKISQESFINLYNALAEGKVDLSKKRGATFCPLNKDRHSFCETVDIFESELKEMGLNIDVEGFKLDAFSQKDDQLINSWVEKLLLLEEAKVGEVQNAI
ncbi:flavodoxin I [Orenia metallireducens]|jgi:flavodoxin I|uniref:Flavodoxin I n=1 Tax=Orenia metallireducens TaxID=1413210 RepID=A0A285HUT7_9FIRM|nr:flavodoxin domain-containing protein [Orenia metallireducens]PRX30998.1 flavodoxin I [Orenia metallireducens]SNY39465.1 flavodoxin I [Orenia metallireducens]